MYKIKKTIYLIILTLFVSSNNSVYATTLLEDILDIVAGVGSFGLQPKLLETEIEKIKATIARDTAKELANISNKNVADRIKFSQESIESYQDLKSKLDITSKEVIKVKDFVTDVIALVEKKIESEMKNERIYDELNILLTTEEEVFSLLSLFYKEIKSDELKKNEDSIENYTSDIKKLDDLAGKLKVKREDLLVSYLISINLEQAKLLYENILEIDLNIDEIRSSINFLSGKIEARIEAQKIIINRLK